MGGACTQIGEYFLPDLKLPEEETKPIGVWGQRHKCYLKEHKRAIYTTLLTSGKMNNIRNRAMEIVNGEIIFAQ